MFAALSLFPIGPGPSVVLCQEPRDQPVDPDRADGGAAEEPDDHEDGRGPYLPVQPVPRQSTNERGDQQEDPYLREQGEIGSGLT